MKIRLNIDTRGYTEKPVDFYGAIRNRLYTPECIAEIDPAELPAYVQQGRTFTASVMEQRTKEGWKQQQVLAIDIDNAADGKADGGKQPIENVLMPKEALAILARYKVVPYFMYYTFSSTQDWPRYRIIFILDRAIMGAATAEDLGKKLVAVINEERPGSADTGSSQIDRMYAGSRPGSVFYMSKNITDVETLKKLPAVKTPEPVRREYIQPERIHGGRLEELEQKIETAVQTFDLAGYIENSTNSKAVKHGAKLFFNPCPICGHKDCFTVEGGLYCCFSSSHPGSNGDKPPGGNIITFLQESRGLEYGAARDYFKYDIMRGDPEEWKQAYKEEMQTREQQRQEAEMQRREMEAQAEKKAENKSMMESFLETVQSEAYRPYETGLSFFDSLLGGGVVRQTILLLLAAPGAGKTTLCQQIAEEMARHGKPVVYLNFEMSREQMIAKAISGRTHRKQGGGKYSALEVLQGYKWTPEQKEEILAEAAAYEQEILQHLQYNPAGISSDLDTVKGYLDRLGEEAQKANTEAPVIIVDYLHLIGTTQRMDTQELIKAVIRMLKDYAIKNNTFVIAISATNRTSNSQGRISLESARDSSAIEYTADYQLSLNYYEVDKGNVQASDPEEMGKLQTQPWRQMILRLNKSRFTMPGRTAQVYFYAKGNTFYSPTEWMPADPERVPFDKTPEKKPEPKQQRF